MLQLLLNVAELEARVVNALEEGLAERSRSWDRNRDACRQHLSELADYLSGLAQSYSGGHKSFGGLEVLIALSLVAVFGCILLHFLNFIVMVARKGSSAR